MPSALDDVLRTTEELRSDACELLVDHVGLDVTPGEIRTLLEESYRKDLEGERAEQPTS